MRTSNRTWSFLPGNPRFFTVFLHKETTATCVHQIRSVCSVTSPIWSCTACHPVMLLPTPRTPAVKATGHVALALLCPSSPNVRAAGHPSRPTHTQKSLHSVLQQQSGSKSQLRYKLPVCCLHKYLVMITGGLY